MDYYGKRLATCSSDKTIKIFNIKPKGGQTHVADLVGLLPLFNISFLLLTFIILKIEDMKHLYGRYVGVILNLVLNLHLAHMIVK